jgi:rRNA maturation endonuclease Nob1
MVGVGEAERLKCPACGATTDKATNYCGQCGGYVPVWQKVIESGITIVEIISVCPNCEKQFTDLFVRFCPDDGALLKRKRKETKMGIKNPR